MISAIASNLQKPSQPLVLTPTRLEDHFKKNKCSLAIFKELKEGEKLGKILNEEGKPEYYKVAQYRGMWVSRWYYGEGRGKTIEYLESDIFIEDQSIVYTSGSGGLFIKKFRS